MLDLSIIPESWQMINGREWTNRSFVRHLPNTVIDEETIIAISQTRAILMLAIRLVEWLREPNGLRMPK
jgi:hypothetical protein